MKVHVGASLLIMLLVSCAAPARLRTPSGKPEVFMTGVTKNGESRDSSAGLAESLTAAVADAEIAPQAVRLAGAGRLSASEERTQRSPKHEKEEITGEIAEYDPWESFNEKMFSFNRQLDRLVLKPVATVWNTIVPDVVQRSLRDAFDNLGMPRRLVNNLLQGKGNGAGQELARFLLNTTMGIVGFFDVATELGLEKSDADTGQTLGVYGVGPGPYLVLPFLPPLTVRDGIGFGIDSAMDPLSYFIPLAATAGRTGGRIVNERSLNLELFEGVEETVLDLYTAVRNAYLQRRQQAIAE